MSNFQHTLALAMLSSLRWPSPKLHKAGMGILDQAWCGELLCQRTHCILVRESTKLHWNQNVALLQPWYKKLQKMNLNTVPKWDRLAVPFLGPHAQLSKRTEEKHFTVPFLGPSGGTTNETAKSQNQQQRPTRAPNKKWQLRLVKQRAHRVGTEEARMRSLISIDFPAPEMEPESPVVSALSVPWLQCGDCNAALPRQHH